MTVMPLGSRPRWRSHRLGRRRRRRQSTASPNPTKDDVACALQPHTHRTSLPPRARSPTPLPPRARQPWELCLLTEYRYLHALAHPCCSPALGTVLARRSTPPCRSLTGPASPQLHLLTRRLYVLARPHYRCRVLAGPALSAAPPPHLAGRHQGERKGDARRGNNHVSLEAGSLASAHRR